MKKKWKIITGVFLLLLLIFIIPGLVSSGIKMKTVTHIRQPLTRVFLTFGDPVRLPEWMEGFEKIEHIYGLPFAEGSKYRITVKKGGNKIIAVEEIIKVDWKKRMVLDMKTPEGSVRADIYFFQMDDYAEIMGNFTVTGGDLFTRILLPWMKPVIRKKLNNGMDRFRQMMEKNDTDYPEKN